MNTQRPVGVHRLNTTKAKELIHEKRHENLMEKILERENLKEALLRVERNKGAPGVDNVTVKSLRNYIQDRWAGIKIKLLNGTYKPLPVRRVEISKPNGGTRLLGIPTVLDRLIQQAIAQVLTAIYDPTFSHYSYGFRPERSAHQAVKQAQAYIQQGFTHVVDMDIEKFFDKVNHNILMEKLAKNIADKALMKLIRRYLQAGVMINGCWNASEEGTPQGGPLSPLLANIMLHELDIELENRGHRFVRYADDFNIYVKSNRAGMRVMDSVKRFVGKRLKLKVNEEKSAVDRPWNRKMLGFSFTNEEQTRIRMAPQTIKRFREKMRQLTGRLAGESMQVRLIRINTYLKGWIGYFALVQTRFRINELDGWIRRRLRACLLKQWRKPKTKLRNLISLGLDSKWAGRISGSRKMCWRLSLSPQVSKALGCAYWREQGLVGLAERYDVLRNAL